MIIIISLIIMILQSWRIVIWIMEDGTTSDGLHSKVWLNFQGLEKN